MLSEAKIKPLTPNMGSYLQENDERVNFEVREVQKGWRQKAP
jgi:hypothetical protein